MAVPFLTAQLGANARLAVDIAWGADLTDIDGSGWIWTDITSDVRMDPGVTTNGGRGDEASTSQPAKMACTLTNTTGSYSLGFGTNYPNVRRNVPVRVRVNPNDGLGYRVAFQGYAVGFTPGWLNTAAGKLPIVTLVAAGVMRRIGQGKDPLRSALYRYNTITNTDHAVVPVEYWPLEEDKAAEEAASVTGGAPGQFAVLTSAGKDYGKITWGGDTDNPATARAVKISAGAQLNFPVRSALFNANYFSCQWSMRYTSGSGGWMDFYTTGIHKIRLTFYTDGSIDVDEAVSGSSTTRISIGASQPAFYDDSWHAYSWVVDQTSATITWSLYRDGALLGSVASTTLNRGMPTMVSFLSVPSPGNTEDPVTIAHLGLISSTTYVSEHAFAANAYQGEFAEDRAVRLCDEEAVALDVVGNPTVDVGMGPQRPLPFLTLLREVETVDQGVLYDGVGPGLRYVARDQRENTATDLAIAATNLVEPFEPTDDDQRNVNRATATSATGAKAKYEDTDGPLGTNTIGVYDSSIDPNVSDSSFLGDYAGWAVHLGTVEGYRYPSVTMNLRASSSFAPAVLDVTPSSRITISNVSSLSLPDETVDLLAEGIAHTLTPYEWKFTAKCSPYKPWIVGTIASETGDTDDDLLRLTTDGAFVSYKPLGPGTNGSGNNVSVVPALPAGIAAGDLLLIFAAIRNSGTGTPNTPTGYTLLAGSANARVFGKIAGGSETAPTVSFTGGVANATTLATMVAYSGVSLTVQNSAEQLNGSAQNIATPALTGINNSALVLWFGWKQDDWTSVDSLVTGLIDEVFESASTTGDDAGIVVDHLVISSAELGGSVGAGAFTVNGGASAISRGIVLALTVSDTPVGATSLRVATPSGPLWTVNSDDYPLTLDVAGLPVIATACSGSTSPQTFTVQPLTAARHAGDAVDVRYPRVLGL